MTTTHRLILTFDDATGSLAATHRCDVELTGHTVSHAEAVALEHSAPLVECLRRLIDGNRAAMASRAVAQAVQHVAALSGKIPKGQQSLTLAGRVGPLGTVE